MSTINKSQFWQDHITAWQGSGLSQAAYCKQHEIKFHNFAYWRNRLSPAKEPSAKLLKLGGMLASSRMIMNLPLGVRLELSASDLPVVLPAVLHILRESN
ncbi:IS66 family insertion sequence element accessory protein TnpA [Zhongshania aliphaticivorans]|uniref:IS66 family insertion sequence element accessory protein TnpA n=2 Tax=Zhongshania aliphaticivorans TaxID=1470434 RepID=UPI0012E67153|nr:IS66 family insertion sequence element accessory protein TnpB [Zhongshania aliphaticivorans]CAA0093648.1 Uncharacterised protein [Zhongshania aliphaticivorans]